MAPKFLLNLFGPNSVRPSCHLTHHGLGSVKRDAPPNLLHSAVLLIVCYSGGQGSAFPGSLLPYHGFPLFQDVLMVQRGVRVMSFSFSFFYYILSYCPLVVNILRSALVVLPKFDRKLYFLK